MHDEQRKYEGTKYGEKYEKSDRVKFGVKIIAVTLSQKICKKKCVPQCSQQQQIKCIIVVLYIKSPKPKENEVNTTFTSVRLLNRNQVKFDERKHSFHQSHCQIGTAAGMR